MSDAAAVGFFSLLMSTTLAGSLCCEGFAKNSASQGGQQLSKNSTFNK
jgi:hypothetical protein